MNFVKTKRWLLPILSVAVMIAIWEFVMREFEIPDYIIPMPSGVGAYLWDAIIDTSLPAAIWVTLKRLLFGYAIGLVIGIPAGMLCARFNLFKDTLGTLALGLQALPSVCWAPLAIIWFGLTEKAMLFVVVMGTVWSLILATQHGVRNIPPIYTRAARTMGSSGIHMWIHVIAPAAFPSILGGMKQGWAFAWRSLMAAEIYVTVLSGFGLGQLLHYGRELMDMNQVIGVMTVVIIIGLIVDKALFSPIEEHLRKRWGINGN